MLFWGYISKSSNKDTKLYYKINLYFYRYSLLGDTASRFFIDPVTGEIQTTESLDREMVSEYHLVVMATDSGNIPLSSSVEVIVKVEDVNDNPLVFTQQDFRLRVRNPTEQGMCVCKIKMYYYGRFPLPCIASFTSPATSLQVRRLNYPWPFVSVKLWNLQSRIIQL